MGILDTDKTLPTNRLVFEVRRDPGKFARFQTDLDGLMRDYGLSPAEQRALKTVDLQALAALGVHPYFLPQIARLFKGGGYNHNDSEAAQLYASQMVR